MNNIRNVTPDDAPAIAQIYNTYVLDSTATFEAVAIDPHTMRKRIQAIFPAFPYLATKPRGACWDMLRRTCGKSARQGHTRGNRPMT